MYDEINMANENLPIQEVAPKIKVWKVTPYKDSMLYIRQINDDIFEYLACWNNQIYGDYIVITPKEGSTELTEAEKNTAFQWIFIAATTSVDVLRGEEVQGAKREEASEVLKVMEETGNTVLGAKLPDKKVN